MKKLLLYCLLFCTGSPCCSQSWAWAKTGLYGGLSRSNDLAVDPWGNMYAVGYFTSSISWGSTVLNSEGGTDVFIVKYNSSGNFTWAKRYGGKGDDEGWGIGTDSLGNVYASGSFQDTIMFGSNSIITKGFDDLFIVKLDSAGNQLWAKSAGGPYPDLGGKLTTNSKGEIFMTGFFADVPGPPYTYGPIDFDAIQLTSTGSGDMFLVKYDPDGNVLWAKKGGGLNQDVGGKVALGKDGDIYVSGVYSGPSATFAQFTIPNNGFADAFLVKYDSIGTVQWVKSGVGPSDEYGTSAVIDGYGNINGLLKQDFGRKYPLKQSHINQLREFRNNIVHTKTAVNDMIKHRDLYSQALKFKYSESFYAVMDFINFYQPNLIEECNCNGQQHHATSPA